MNETGKRIAILSLGQILATLDEETLSPRGRETVTRHIRQVAAIVQERPFNKPDESTETVLSQVGAILEQISESAPEKISAIG
jgi:hypothetical protein